MTGQPVRWRVWWALAQVTGVIASSVFWIVLAALSVETVVAALLGGVVFVAAFRTRPVLWLAFGARAPGDTDRDQVLRAIVPVASLRGRHQPRVLVAAGRRAAGWNVAVPGPHLLVVSGALLDRIRTRRVSDAEVSALVAHAFGQLPALGSRAVLAVELYCLPWAFTRAVVDRVAGRLSRAPLMSLSWTMRPVVFGLGLVDAVGHARWIAAVPLGVLIVLTYTTGPLDRAWKRALDRLGDRRVSAEGLGPVFAGMVLDPRAPADRRRADILLGVRG